MFRKLFIIFAFVAIALVASLSYRFYFAKSSTAVNRTGLVGYWTMDANDINGTTMYDKSGNNKNAVLAASPGTVAGQIRQAMRFNGSTQYASSTIATPAPITVSLWFKANDLDNNDTLIAKNRGGSNPLFLFQFASSKLQLWTMNTVTSAGATTLQTGRWYHAAFTYDNNNNRVIYLNGVQDGSTNTATVWTDVANQSLQMAGWDAGGGAFTYPYNGSIDDVRVYNYVMSAQEVANLYNAAKQDYVTAPVRASSTPGGGGQLVGYWTMDSNDMSSTGAALYDRSGQNKNGTVTGTTTSTGRSGQARNFNGTSDTISIGNFPQLNTAANNFSLSFWVNASAAQTNHAIFAYDANDVLTPSADWYVMVKTTLVIGGIGDAAEHDTGITMLDGKWHLFTITKNAGVLTVYKDAVSSYSNSGANNHANFGTTFNLKFAGVYNVSRYNGKLDDIRLYNYALSAQEVANLYNASARNFVSAPPRTGLVGYWTMDSNDMSSTGATLYDRSGQNNHGTVTGTTTSTGRIAQSRNFNGTSNQVSLGSNDILNMHYSSRTIAAWIKTSATVSQRIFNKEYGANTPLSGYALMTWTGGKGALVYAPKSGTTENIILTDSVIADNRWHHLVGVINRSGNLDLYIDGVQASVTVQAGSRDISGSSGTDVTDSLVSTIGVNTSLWGGASGEYWSGQIDDVRVYNYALSAQEVANLYQSSARSYK
jgi:hypothetical protein